MNLLLIPIEKSKALPNDVKAWRLMDPALQTWTAFKTHFERANEGRNRTFHTNTAGYHALNVATTTLQITKHSANAAAIISPGTIPSTPMWMEQRHMPVLLSLVRSKPLC